LYLPQAVWNINGRYQEFLYNLEVWDYVAIARKNLRHGTYWGNTMSCKKRKLETLILSQKSVTNSFANYINTKQKKIRIFR